jgi:hypothetical protein
MADLKYDLEFYSYLDDLRVSGVTNMFGAGAYLEAEFDLDKPTARAVLIDWMETFDARRRADRFIWHEGDLVFGKENIVAAKRRAEAEKAANVTPKAGP